jgi:ribonuclease BN (tRNA processing enzyme)
MQIEVLGAHMSESLGAGVTSLLIDEVLALDAGSLASSLSLHAQQKLKAILLTHHHYDHVRDIPAIAMNFSNWGAIKVYSTASTLEILSAYLFDGKLYPNFREWPPQRPAIEFLTVEPHNPLTIEGYRVLALPVNHSVPTVGYEVVSPQGGSIFYTGDTGPGLSRCWERISPDLLITEGSGTNELEEKAIEVGHLTPSLLKQELTQFQKLKGYLPPVIIVHLSLPMQEQVEKELKEVAAELGTSITPAWEGMKVTV